MFDLSTRDIKYLQGVGPQRAAILNKELNIYSFRDLLYYFPYKYVDRSRLYYIHEIDGNMPYIQLKGKVLSFETMGEGRQRRLVGHFSDGTGIVSCVAGCPSGALSIVDWDAVTSAAQAAYMDL